LTSARRPRFNPLEIREHRLLARRALARRLDADGPVSAPAIEAIAARSERYSLARETSERRDDTGSGGSAMGDPGLEPGTSSLSEKRSNRLS
jgi:hypothetical protein